MAGHWCQGRGALGTPPMQTVRYTIGIMIELCDARPCTEFEQDLGTLCKIKRKSAITGISMILS